MKWDKRTRADTTAHSRAVAEQGKTIEQRLLLRNDSLRHFKLV